MYKSKTKMTESKTKQKKRQRIKEDRQNSKQKRRQNQKEIRQFRVELIPQALQFMQFRGLQCTTGTQRLSIRTFRL
jgi:hypothetical protein